MPIELPERCLRDRSDCQPLAQIQSDDGPPSFICCGYNDGTTRTEPGDRFRLCWKSKHIDELSDWDQRDLTDTASIILQALSIDGQVDLGGREPSAEEPQ